MPDLEKVIIFRLNDQAYGVNILDVQSVETMQQLTPVPRGSALIKGMMKHHGDSIPVIDLKERLNLGETNGDNQTRMLIINMDDAQTGLMVDEASYVTTVDPAAIEAAPAMINGDNEFFLRGVVKQDNNLLILLALKQILNAAELNEVKDVTMH